MRVPLTLALVAAVATVASAAQDTVVGRMVPARHDAPSVASTGSARATYVLHCGGCHGLDGRGAPERYVPDLRRIGRFLQVDGGRGFIVQVPGVMGSGLDDTQVAAVTNWLLATLARDSAPPGTPPYSAAEVARWRAQPLVDVALARRRLLATAQAGGVAID